MRFIVLLAMGLSFAYPAFARTKIKLHSLTPQSSTAEIEFKADGILDIGYLISHAKPNQNYGFFIYAHGNCAQFSDQVEPLIINEKGEIKKPLPDSNALILTRTPQFRDGLGGGTFRPDLKFHKLNLSRKMIVLEETKGGKSIGVAVACGIHP